MKMLRNELHHKILLEVVYSQVIEHLQTLVNARKWGYPAQLFLHLSSLLPEDRYNLIFLHLEDPDEYSRTLRIRFPESLKEDVEKLCADFSTLTCDAEFDWRKNCQPMFDELKAFCEKVANGPHS
jgi:hypothetical protein